MLYQVRLTILTNNIPKVELKSKELVVHKKILY